MSGLGYELKEEELTVEKSSKETITGTFLSIDFSEQENISFDELEKSLAADKERRLIHIKGFRKLTQDQQQ